MERLRHGAMFRSVEITLQLLKHHTGLLKVWEMVKLIYMLKIQGKLIPHKLVYPPQKQSERSIINTDDKDPDYVPDIIELVKQRHIPIVCNVLLESFLGRFQRYLQGPDGGNKEISNAKQIVSEVRRMFVALKNGIITGIVWKK